MDVNENSNFQSILELSFVLVKSLAPTGLPETVASGYGT